MIRLSTIALVAAAVLLAVSSAAVAQPQQEKTPGPLALIAKLYQESAAAAVFENADLVPEDLFGRSKLQMSHYLDDDLVALVMADRACAKRTEGVCNLDFLPIWDAQDPVGMTVKLTTTKDPARVLAELHAGKTVYRLSYLMAKTPAGWRIHDIQYGSHESLVTILKAKPAGV